jgi:thioredoxin 1
MLGHSWGSELSAPDCDERGITMAGPGVVEVSDDDFEQEVLQSKVPVLVDFWAPWCGPCRVIAPVIDELATQTKDRFRVAKMNIDDSPNTPSKYNVSAIPTLLIFKGGEPVQRFTGVTGKAEIERALATIAG